MNIALLPMKGHSSRVPEKNFRPIHGKPLFRWILDVLLQLEFIDKVVIDTDAVEQLRGCGLQPSDRVVLKERPEHLLGDEVSMNLILAHDLTTHPADHYLMTHTTNPILSAATLSDAWQTYQTGLADGHDSLFGVNRFQTRFYTRDVRPINHDPDNLIPTQDLEPWFEENSCYYFFNPGSFACRQARIGAQPLMHETPTLENIDIDEWKDWHLAEAVLKMRDEVRL